MREATRSLVEETAGRPDTDHFTVPGWWEALGIIAGQTGAGVDFTITDEDSAWESLGERLCPGGFHTTAISRQVHGTSIGVVGAMPGCHRAQGLDGHRTNRAGVLLGLTVADCVPVFLASRTSGHLALLHAGWRGVAGGIIELGLEDLRNDGVEPSDLVMHLGVGICGDCYEVGPEVFEALGMARPAAPTPVNLREAVADRAAAAGVTAITVSAWCSQHDRRFHSYRRDGERSGRMAAFLGRPLG